MNNDLKSELHKLIDAIEDENALHSLMEDAAVYAGKNETADELTDEQIKELEEALAEADRGDTISYQEFKKHTAEWIKNYPDISFFTAL